MNETLQALVRLVRANDIKALETMLVELDATIGKRESTRLYYRAVDIVNGPPTPLDIDESDMDRYGYR